MTLVASQQVNKMAKATTIKDALTKLEEKEQKKMCDCEVVKINGIIPSIEKMDASLSTLTHCKTLSLSTNQIEKIANLNALKCLTILSLGRNNIKSLTGLEAVGDTLEQLWISYNLIEKLKGLSTLKKLKVLYMSNNLVKDSAEFSHLGNLPCLEDLVLVGNPIHPSMQMEKDSEAEVTFRVELTNRCSKLKKLDGIPIVREEEE
ncbi:Dynein light chain 1, axonemal [Nucella lapillus]